MRLTDLLGSGDGEPLCSTPQITPEPSPVPDEPALPPVPEAAEDTPAVPSEVVQPPEESAAARRAKAPLRFIAICAAIGLMLIAALATRRASPTPEQYMRAAASMPDQAYVTLYVKDTRINQLSGKAYPTWHYTLYLREDHGVGFQIESLRFVYFLEDGSTRSMEWDAAKVAQVCLSSHLNGYGMMKTATGYTPGSQNPAHPTGVGVMLKGRDDSGNRLTFPLYLPLEPYTPSERAS